MNQEEFNIELMNMRALSIKLAEACDDFRSEWSAILADAIIEQMQKIKGPQQPQNVESKSDHDFMSLMAESVNKRFK